MLAAANPQISVAAAITARRLTVMPSVIDEECPWNAARGRLHLRRPDSGSATRYGGSGAGSSGTDFPTRR
jgi:hypothetical protein